MSSRLGQNPDCFLFSLPSLFALCFLGTLPRALLVSGWECRGHVACGRAMTLQSRHLLRGSHRLLRLPQDSSIQAPFLWILATILYDLPLAC